MENKKEDNKLTYIEKEGKYELESQMEGERYNMQGHIDLRSLPAKVIHDFAFNLKNEMIDFPVIITRMKLIENKKKFRRKEESNSITEVFYITNDAELDDFLKTEYKKEDRYSLFFRSYSIIEDLIAKRNEKKKEMK